MRLIFLVMFLAAAILSLPRPAAAEAVRVEQNRFSDLATVVYDVGVWQSFQGPALSDDSLVAASATNATMTVTFTGTSIAWIGYRCPCASGSARLTLDGNPAGTLDTYDGSLFPQKVMYRIDDLPYGEHEFAIEVTGQGATDTPFVVLDAFRIVGGNGDADGDTALPTVALTAPADGATVSGTIRIDVAAQDDTGISSVWFYAGGQQVGAAQTTAPPYSTYWDTTTVPDGEYFLSAVVRDEAGNTALPTATPGVSVENVDNAPVVTMTAPDSGAQVTGLVTLRAEATDDYGVTSVRFYYAGTLLGEDTEAPYEITRDTSTIPSGRSFIINARATDTAGNVGQSSGIIVTVQHQAPQLTSEVLK